jgi:uncharacterized protein
MSNVAVLGASTNPRRISNQAIERLQKKGYTVIPVNPKGGEIFGTKVYSSLTSIECPIDTLTMYIAPEHQAAQIDAIERLRPRRIIFNPGSENPDIYSRLEQVGIEVQEACTLVLLSTNQFDRPV